MKTILSRVLGKIRIPSPALLVALLALLIAASGAAFAAIPDQDDTIVACRNTHNGALRVIDAEKGQTCRANESQLSWIAGSDPGSDSMPPCITGEIRLFSSQHTGFGWELAQGQVLQIIDNEPLFSLFGTKFGGDGQNTFALPNLQAQAPENTYYAICTEGVYPDN